MNDLCNDLLAEYDELADLCDSLTDAQWQQASPFYGWAPWDEVAHLAYFDEAATEAITDAQVFQKSAQALMQLMLRGDEISAVARAHYAATPDRRLLSVWRTRYQHLVSLLRDAYIEWDKDQVLDWVIRYWELARKAGLPVVGDPAEFYRQFEWMGLQRHLKVLGIFARLYHRDGKSGYLKDLPLVLAYTRQVAGNFRVFSPLMRLLDRLDNIEVQVGYTF